ncbi:MAG: fucose isomerase [Fibrobacteria bacterium]|nr:fucose isomerase [Fibrobacteria bacterium]
MSKATVAVIVGTRGFFPSSLATEGRKDLLAALKQLDIDPIIMPEDATPYGAVETLADAKKYAAYFSQHRDSIEGIIISLPNFGDELGIIETLSRAKLNVPLLVQACDDTVSKMDLAHRRDSFCGKLSVCANLDQHGFDFTNTTLHTCAIDSQEFTSDLERFALICKTYNNLNGARLGMIGQRPDAFNTVRFSEKLLEASNIHVSTVDLSTIIFGALNWSDTEAVKSKIKDITGYGPVDDATTNEQLEKQAKLILTIEKWVEDNECDATAIQCWDSIQKNYGCATCLCMSMMGENGKPSACEVDVTGALTMLALRYASGGNAPGYLDWNNNYNDERDKCVNIHCSNYPKSFIGKIDTIGNLDILGASLGEDRCFGAIKGVVQPGPMTYAKISTDDLNGTVRMYVGEGEFTNDPINTAGGAAICKVPGLQKLLDYMCHNGFEHHVAMVRGNCAGILAEVCEKYMGWDVYVHET